MYECLKGSENFTSKLRIPIGPSHIRKVVPPTSSSKSGGNAQDEVTEQAKPYPYPPQ